RADGILTEAEYAAKRATLGEQLLTTIDAPAATPRSGFAAALAIALLLPAVAIALYRYVGDPRALDPAAMTQAPPNHGESIEQAIAGLVEKLKQNPNDAEGWALLGRAYEATEHFAQARDALKHAYDLAPEDPDIEVAYAEAMTVASDSRRIEGEARALIEKALKAAPDHVRGLWLLGISDYQAKKYDTAIAAWKHVLAVLPKDSDAVHSIERQIAVAEAERDGRAPPPEEAAPAAGTASEAAAPAAADAGAAHLTVEVALDAKLKNKVSPGDTLFVYAKAASGPPMPLAIKRMQAGDLPATVVLSDGMGMMPTLKLSQFPQVIVAARVSKSGNAIAQSGDLQALSAPVDVHTSAPIKLTIDQAVP